MKTKPSLLELLRKQPELYFRDLPENIRIPALDGNRPDEVVRRLEDATIDDLAFAIQGMESESRLIHRRLGGLRHTLNAWGYPAKDRSGRLDPIEEPHLGRLMEKIAGPARPATERLDFARPAPAAAPVPNTESTSTQES